MFYKIQIDFLSKNIDFDAEFIAKESLTYKALLQNILKLMFDEFKEYGSGNFYKDRSLAIQEGELDIKYYLPSGTKVYVDVTISQIELIK